MPNSIYTLFVLKPGDTTFLYCMHVCAELCNSGSCRLIFKSRQATESQVAPAKLLFWLLPSQRKNSTRYPGLCP